MQKLKNMSHYCKKMTCILEENHAITYQGRTRTYNVSTGRLFTNEETGLRKV